MLTFGELFAGVGGFSLGFEQAGWECRWQVEWDKHCQSVLARHWPDVERFGDVRDVAGGRLRPIQLRGNGGHHGDTVRSGLGDTQADRVLAGGVVPLAGRPNNGRNLARGVAVVDGEQDTRSVLQPVDCITFGSPCQDLSVAGKRAGLAGERSGLFHEAIRIIKEMRDATAGTLPRFAIWENVAGALSSNKGDDFLAVLDAFAEIGAVDIAWRLVDAQFFGVPQRRRRVFVVADFGGECAGAVHVEPAGMRWHPPQGGTAGEAVAGSFGVSIAGTLGSTSGGFRTTDLDGIGAYVPTTAGTLAAGAHPGSYNGQDAYNDLLIPYPIQDCREMDKVQNGLGVGGPHDPMYTLDRVAQHGAAFVKAKRASSPDDDESWRADGPAPTLNQFDNNSDTRATVVISPTLTASNDPSRSPQSTEVTNQIMAVHAATTAVRRLTPRECERLMGWPDDHTRWRADGTEQADSQRYRQCGNGIVAPVAAWLAWNLKIALQTESETQ